MCLICIYIVLMRQHMKKQVMGNREDLLGNWLLRSLQKCMDWGGTELYAFEMRLTPTYEIPAQALKAYTFL